MVVEEIGKSVDETYTSEEILELVKGRFGAEKFSGKVNGEYA